MTLGAPTQCSVTTYRGSMGWGVGKMFKREGTYVYLWLIHERQKTTQHCKAMILQLLYFLIYSKHSFHQ